MNPAPVLLTGFAPFAGEATNPSREIVRALAGRTLVGHRVITAELPVVFGRANVALAAAIADARPALAIAIGQAGGRNCISLERVAINLIDARIPDNDGCQPIDEPVIAGAPSAYFSTLPVKAMQAAMRAAGVPTEVSFSAGSFVCNAVFFALMHRFADAPGHARGGFIHVPYLPAQAAQHPGAPSMDLETMIRGVAIAVEAALANADDARVAGGNLD